MTRLFERFARCFQEIALLSVEWATDDAHAIAGFEFHFFGSEEAQIVLCGGAEGDETLHLRLVDEGDAVARDGGGATGAGHRLQGLSTHVEVEFLPVTVLHKLLEVSSSCQVA